MPHECSTNQRVRLIRACLELSGELTKPSEKFTQRIDEGSDHFLTNYHLTRRDTK